MKVKKPSGVIMEIADTPANREYMKKAGWTEVKEKKAPKKKAK